MFVFEWEGKTISCISKSDLVIGKTYIGRCRNATKATWDGKNFVYDRTKFCHIYSEKINHPEDFNGFDVFIPTKVE